MIVDCASDHAIISLDLQGRITGWNCGAEVLTGYTAMEALGMSGDLLFTAEDKAADVFTNELCRALDGGRAVNERWHVRRDGTRFWASGTMLPLVDRFGQTGGFLNIWRDGTATQAAAEQRQLILREMNHRLKNAFATVRAIAAQTEYHARTPSDFQEGFEARLLLLARSNEVLMGRGWEDAPLREILTVALGAHAECASMVGLPVLLPAELVVPTSLAFHELTTNAAKYGGLSTPDGRIAIAWKIFPAGRGARRLEIDWVESGGPPVSRPEHRGFGSELLEHGLHSQAKVEMDFQPEGLRCRLYLPLTIPDVPTGPS